MCNGDLGMYRVMPWAYPTIPGQSSGGTTVDPTPEPTPVPKDPFDLSSVKFTLPSQTGEYSSTWGTVDIKLEVRNLISNDTSNVSSVKFELLGQNISINPSTVSGSRLKIDVYPYTQTGSFNNLNGDFMVIRGYDQYNAEMANTTFTPTGVTGVKFTAYGSDGTVLQEYEGVIS